MISHIAENLELYLDISTALATVVFAVAGCIIAYKQTYGSSPLLVLKYWTIFHPNDDNLYLATFILEFWNLRAYPVQIRKIVSTFGKEIICTDEYIDHFFDKIEDDCHVHWFADGNSIFTSQITPIHIHPNAPAKLYMYAVFSGPPGYESGIRVTASYYDPISEREKVVRLRSQFKVPPDDAPVGPWEEPLRRSGG